MGGSLSDFFIDTLIQPASTGSMATTLPTVAWVSTSGTYLPPATVGSPAAGRGSARPWRRLTTASRRAHAEATDRGAVLDELSGLELLVAEVVPPLRALLAAVPPDETGQQLVAVGRRAAPRARSRHAPRRRSRAAARGTGRASDVPGRLELGAPAPRATRAGRASSARPPRCSGGCRRGSTGRPTVVASGEPAFVLDDRREAVGDARAVARSRVAPVELLELLDRVGALADAHALPHDGVEVDEDLVAQQLVELGLARGVLPDEPLERRRLVGRVVVDVHVGVARASGR